MFDAMGRTTETDWIEFFSGFDPIVVVANSEAQALETVRKSVPKTALFVFFNRADRLLTTSFAGNSLLITRSNQAGSELVYRGQVDLVAQKLSPPGFRGFLNLKCADFETLQNPADFSGHAAGALDLSGYLAGFYPTDHTASSGFAIAIWLSEKVTATTVVVSGFTGLRSETRKLFLIHDWSFEQTALRLMQASGRLSYAGSNPPTRYQGLARHFPAIEDPSVIYATLETLTERLENAEKLIDRLLSVTSLQRRFSAWLKSVRPKTRKQRLLQKRTDGDA